MNGSRPEAFSLTDPATGKVRSVREMTDEELIRHAKTTADDMGRLTHAMQQTHHNMMVTGQFLAVLQFEQLRRQRSIVIATAIPGH